MNIGFLPSHNGQFKVVLVKIQKEKTNKQTRCVLWFSHLPGWVSKPPSRHRETNSILRFARDSKWQWCVKLATEVGWKHKVCRGSPRPRTAERGSPGGKDAFLIRSSLEKRRAGIIPRAPNGPSGKPGGGKAKRERGMGWHPQGWHLSNLLAPTNAVLYLPKTWN